MRTEILTKKQQKLLPLVHAFTRDFYLVGGTALALQYGHRHSIDFDLFSLEPFNNAQIRRVIKQHGHTITQVYIESISEFTLLVNDLKMTFYHYDYPIDHPVKLKNIITMPNSLTLAAMKAFTLGHRAKWKDYIDLYFVFQHHTLQEVMDKANSIYGTGEFNERLFREQLAYHRDLDYSEPIEYMSGFAVDNKTIKQKLTAIAIRRKSK